MEQLDKNFFGDRERYLSGKAQMKMFCANQYLYWRVAAVKSMRKILLDADRFYSDLDDEIYSNKPSETATNNQIDIADYYKQAILQECVPFRKIASLFIKNRIPQNLLFFNTPTEFFQRQLVPTKRYTIPQA